MDKNYKTIDSKSLNSGFRELPKILELQKTWIRKRDYADPNQGFLISSFDENEVKELLMNGAKFELFLLDDTLVGYSLETPITEFSNLLNDSTKARFETNSNIELNDSVTYLYQIVSAGDSPLKSVGKDLLNRMKVRASQNKQKVLTDVLTSPISNDRSLRFFKNNGFRKCGDLYLASYRDFGELRSEVMIWP